HPRMEALHQRNAARLAALIDAHGWPGRSRVGEEGAQAAWLILQHAIGNPPLVRRGLTLLRGGVSEGADSQHDGASHEYRNRRCNRCYARAGRETEVGTRDDLHDVARRQDATSHERPRRASCNVASWRRMTFTVRP